LVPVAQECGDLGIVEVFQCGVDEAGVAQLIWLIADDSRGDDDGRLGISRRKRSNLFDY